MKNVVSFKPLSPGFGVEAVGIDLSQALDDDQTASIRQALDTHQLIVFRGQTIDAKDQIRALSIFGKVSDESSDGLFHTFVSNVRPDGLFGDLALTFHSDFGFVDYQPPVISLYGVEVGSEAGPTVFANCVGAVARLSASQRERLQGRKVMQIARFAGGNAKAASADDTRSKLLGLKETPMESPFRSSIHPVLRPHPRTGTPLLFISEKHTSHIEGLQDEESSELLKDLFKVLYDPQNLYTHRWTSGDLVVWDNVATQHGRPAPKVAGPDGRRTLRRVLVSEKTARELLGDSAQYGGDG